MFNIISNFPMSQLLISKPVLFQMGWSLITPNVLLFSAAGSSNSSIQEEIPSRRSPLEPRSVELGSQHSSGPRSAASSRSSASSRKRGKKERKCSTWLQSILSYEGFSCQENCSPAYLETVINTDRMIDLFFQCFLLSFFLTLVML